MIRIDIPEVFINDIISDIKQFRLNLITKSTRKLFSEIEIQAKSLENNKLTKEEEDLGLDLSFDLFESLTFKNKIKTEIMKNTIKYLGDNSLEFDHISAELKRKYFARTLLEKPEKKFYNLVFDLTVSYKILSMEEKMEIDLFSQQDIDTCKNCNSWNSSLDCCMGCIRIKIKKTLKGRNK